MQAKNEGIPTLYRGRRFRSRLEAKYAALFDQLGWSWEYEPIDLQGWIPDFVIEGKPVPILVEIKPIFEFDFALGAKIDRIVGHPNIATRDEIQVGQIDYNYQCKYETVICGARIFKTEYGALTFGWLWDYWWDDMHVISDGGLCHVYNNFKDRVTGQDGGLWDSADLDAMWAYAGNLVQWNAR
jgi:hypothetical protein